MNCPKCCREMTPETCAAYCAHCKLEVGDPVHSSGVHLFISYSVGTYSVAMNAGRYRIDAHTFVEARTLIEADGIAEATCGAEFRRRFGQMVS